MNIINNSGPIQGDVRQLDSTAKAPKKNSEIPPELFSEKAPSIPKHSYNNFLINRHNHRIETFLGIDLPIVSHNNFNRIRNQLRQGVNYLESIISHDSKTAKLSKEEIDHYQGMLTEREVALFEFLTTNLTIKHATNSKCLESSKELLSLKERENQRLPILNRHTSRKWGIDDDIYFVVGIGNHATPMFLDGFADTLVTININEMQNRDTESANRLWCSPHISEYLSKRPSKLTSLGESTYEFSHSWEDRKKVYKVKREDGTAFEWTAKFEDECFIGGEVAPGIAYQFIQVFRLLGYNNSYVKKVYNTLLDNSVPFEDKVECLSTAMTTIFPGWVYPEGKIINRLELDKPYIEISRIEPTEDPLTTQDQYDVLIDVAKRGDEEYLKYLLEQGISPDVRLSHYKSTALLKVIDEFANEPDKVLELVKILIAKGADPTLKTDPSLEKNCATKKTNPLRLAIQLELPKVFEYLYSREYAHEKEPLIRYRMRPCSVGSKQNDAFALAIKVENKSEEILDILIKNTSLNEEKKYTLLLLAIENKNEFLFNYLIDQGVELKADEEVWNMTPLMLAAEIGFDLALEYLLKKIKNPNTSFRAKLFVEEKKAYLPSHLNGYTALHFAAMNGHVKACKRLLNAGADPSIQGDNKMNAYDLARNCPEIRKLILPNSEPTSFSAQDAHNCFSLLSKHLKMNLVNIVEQVAGIVTKTGSDRKLYVLMGKKRNENGLAIDEYMFPGGLQSIGENETIEEAGIREIAEETGLKISLENSHPVAVADITYKRKADIIFKRHTTFLHFDASSAFQAQKIRSGDDFIDVKLIPVDSIIPVNEPGKPLRYVCGSDRVSIRLSNALLIMQLTNQQKEKNDLPSIQEVIEVEENGEALLKEAAEKNNTEEIRKLLSFGVKDTTKITSETKYNPAFEYLIEHDNTQALGLLLEHGFDINYSDSYRTTNPLYIAVKSKNLSMVRFLLDRGAQFNTDIIELVFQEGCHNNNDEYCNLIFNHPNFDVNQANVCLEESFLGMIDTVKVSPLQLAIEYNRLDLVRFLIENKKENVNRERVNETMCTMLQLAISVKRKEIASYLLALQTSNLSLRSAKGKKVQDYVNKYAKKKGWSDISQAISIYEKYSSFSALLQERYKIFPEKLKWTKDGQGQPTLHVMFANKSEAEILKKGVKGTLRSNDQGLYYVRLGVKRLETVLGGLEVATFFFEKTRESPFWKIFTNDYSSILHDTIKSFTINGEIIDSKWSYLSTLLRQNNSIRELTVDLEKIKSDDYAELVQIFKSQNLIQKLSFVNVPNSDEGINTIFDFLAVLPDLRELNWSSSALSESSKQKMIERVIIYSKDNRAIEKKIEGQDSVSLSFKESQKPLETKEEMIRFKTKINSLRTDPNCSSIYFSQWDCNYGEDISYSHHQQLEIFQALAENTTLEKISLIGITITDVSFQIFLECLKSHPSLRSITLNHCSLSSQNIEQFCEILLKRGIPTTHLDLRGNKVTCTIIKSICKLFNNEDVQLESLALSIYDLYYDSDFETLGDHLQGDNYLKVLDIKEPSLYLRQLKPLAQALEKNHTLTELRFNINSDRPETKATERSIQSFLERNRRKLN